MKKSHNIFIIMTALTIVFIPKHVFAIEQSSVYKIEEEIEIDWNNKVLSNDEEIIKLLKVYHSYETGLEDPQIYFEDIAEFKANYYFFTKLNVLKTVPFPGYYSYYYKVQTTWLTRSDGITLSVHYKPEAMYISADNGNIVAAYAANAFDVLRNRHIGDTHWNNIASMSAQFHCHYLTIGNLKNPWNLEPWRTETNLLKTISKACNP